MKCLTEQAQIVKMVTSYLVSGQTGTQVSAVVLPDHICQPVNDASTSAIITKNNYLRGNPKSQLPLNN